MKKKYLFDTDVLIDLLKDKSYIVDFIRANDIREINVSSITFYELLKGVNRLPKNSKFYKQSLFFIENIIKPRKLTKDVFVLAAEIFAKLAKEGKKLHDLDILIASTAILEERVLVTRNIKHFKRIKGLKLEASVT